MRNILPSFMGFNLTGQLTSGLQKICLEQQGSLKLEIGGGINLRLPLPSELQKKACRGDIRGKAGDGSCRDGRHEDGERLEKPEMDINSPYGKS